MKMPSHTTFPFVHCHRAVVAVWWARMPHVWTVPPTVAPSLIMIARFKHSTADDLLLQPFLCFATYSARRTEKIKMKYTERHFYSARKKLLIRNLNSFWQSWEACQKFWVKCAAITLCWYTSFKMSSSQKRKCFRHAMSMFNCRGCAFGWEGYIWRAIQNTTHISCCLGSIWLTAKFWFEHLSLIANWTCWPLEFSEDSVYGTSWVDDVQHTDHC